MRSSIRCNKGHKEARNLLGLVYFEMGEVVAALSEWIINQNLHEGDKEAGRYLRRLQKDADWLDQLSSTLQNYNRALAYCQQDSLDLAFIQIKRVISINPSFVRARLLIALMYMAKGEWDKAARHVDKARAVDRGNALANDYKKRIEEQLAARDKKSRGKSKGKEEQRRYVADNELIIQPAHGMHPRISHLVSLVNIFIGLALGMAVMYFLVLPAFVSDANAKAAERVVEIGNQLDAKTSRIGELEAQLAAKDAQMADLQAQLDAYAGDGGLLSKTDALMAAQAAYAAEGDKQALGLVLESLGSAEGLPAGAAAIYQQLFDEVAQELGTAAGESGLEALEQGDYAKAVSDLARAVFYAPDDGELQLALAQAYAKNGDGEAAKALYASIVEKFAGSQWAQAAEEALADSGE